MSDNHDRPDQQIAPPTGHSLHEQDCPKEDKGSGRGKGRKKKAPAMGKQEIAYLISNDELTFLDLMVTNNLEQVEASALLAEILAEDQIDLKAAFFDAVKCGELPPRLAKRLGGTPDAIVKFRAVEGGVGLYLAAHRRQSNVRRRSWSVCPARSPIFSVWRGKGPSFGSNPKPLALASGTVHSILRGRAP